MSIDPIEPIELKPPRTYEEQLNIFRCRGLVIDDEVKALETLKRINYYRLTAYMLTFKKDNVFLPGTTFEKVYRHYEFDSN